MQLFCNTLMHPINIQTDIYYFFFKFTCGNMNILRKYKIYRNTFLQYSFHLYIKEVFHLIVEVQKRI